MSLQVNEVKSQVRDQEADLQEQLTFLTNEKDNLTELERMWELQEGFIIVRHPFVRLVSAYEVNILVYNSVGQFSTFLRKFACSRFA